ncbi:hypothetical protein HUU42_07625 [bacterium]|nr:hypothetical protein [bacterium]
MKKALFGLLLFLVSCQDTKIVRETVELPLRVNGSIWTWYEAYDSATHSDADFFVDNFNAIPTVSINGIEADDPFEAGYNHFDFDKPVFPADSMCRIIVRDGEKSATCQIAVPRKAAILSPAPGTIMQSRDLSATWKNANADFYEFYCYYVYEDLQGWYWSKDTLISDYKDTTIVLLNFLPDLQFIRSFWYGYLSVLSIRGPELKSGIEGNVKDDGLGFIWSYYWQPGVEFTFSPQGTHTIPELPVGFKHRWSREHVMRNYVKRMIIQQGYDTTNLNWLCQ